MSLTIEQSMGAPGVSDTLLEGTPDLGIAEFEGVLSGASSGLLQRAGNVALEQVLTGPDASTGDYNSVRSTAFDAAL